MNQLAAIGTVNQRLIADGSPFLFAERTLQPNSGAWNNKPLPTQKPQNYSSNEQNIAQNNKIHQLKRKPREK